MAADGIRLAYMLLCHKDATQINGFVKQLLSYGDCDIYIHVDKKNEKLVEEIEQNEHVFCYSEYKVEWGSFEIVQAAIFLMQKIRESGKEYSHVYFGSGQDLIVRRGLYEHLLSHGETKAFIRINREVKKRDRQASRFLIRWPKRLLVRNNLHPYRFIRILIQLLCKMGIRLFPNKRKLENPVKFYWGGTWFVITQDMMEYILDYCDSHPDYVDYWRDSLASDLMFFQTIIMNSPHKEQVENELIFVQFGKSFKTKNHPVTVTESDVKTIEESGKFFARKFEPSVDTAVIVRYLALTKENAAGENEGVSDA